MYVITWHSDVRLIFEEKGTKSGMSSQLKVSVDTLKLP